MSRKFLGGISQILVGVASQMKLTPGGWALVLSGILKHFRGIHTRDPGKDHLLKPFRQLLSKNRISGLKIERRKRDESVYSPRGPGYTKVGCAFYRHHHFWNSPSSCFYSAHNPRSDQGGGRTDPRLSKISEVDAE